MSPISFYEFEHRHPLRHQPPAATAEEIISHQTSTGLNFPFWRSLPPPSPSAVASGYGYGYTRYKNRRGFTIRPQKMRVIRLFDKPCVLSNGIKTNFYRGCMWLKNCGETDFYVDKFTVLETLVANTSGQLKVKVFRS
jgi:hypothetical protein